MNLIQFELSNGQRRVGLVDGDLIREVKGAESVRDLALSAIDADIGLAQQVDKQGLGDSHDYARLLQELRVLPPLDHPDQIGRASCRERV